jgi:hypothetical protein
MRKVGNWDCTQKTLGGVEIKQGFPRAMIYQTLELQNLASSKVFAAMKSKK